jgi:hypothetical protein
MARRRDENGREKSCFVRYRILFLSRPFPYLQVNRNIRKWNGILQEWERKRFGVFPSVYPESPFTMIFLFFPFPKSRFR